MLCLLIRTELIGTQGTSAMLEAMDMFGSEHPSQQWQHSSVKESSMAQRDTQGEELASKVHSIFIITFPTVIIFNIPWLFLC